MHGVASAGSSARSLLLIVALWIASHIPKTIAIFVIAAFIAFGVQPISRRLERYMPKPLAISLVFLALSIVVALFFVIVVPLTINQTQLLAANIPTYATLTQNWLQAVENSLEQHFPTLHIPTTGFNIGKITGAQLSTWVSVGVASFGAIAVNTATGFFIAFSAIILSFFFLLNDTQIAEGFASMFPPSRRATARNLSAEVTELFGNYISGQVLVCAITGTVIAIASAIIGFKLSLIVGIISGVAYAIPIVGMLIAQIIAIPMSAPQGLWMVIWRAGHHLRHGAHQRQRARSQDHGQVGRRFADRFDVRGLRRRRALRRSRLDPRHSGRGAD